MNFDQIKETLDDLEQRIDSAAEDASHVNLLFEIDRELHCTVESQGYLQGSKNDPTIDAYYKKAKRLLTIAHSRQVYRENEKECRFDKYGQSLPSKIETSFPHMKPDLKKEWREYFAGLWAMGKKGKTGRSYKEYAVEILEREVKVLGWTDEEKAWMLKISRRQYIESYK